MILENDHIESIEEFIFALGVYCIEVETIFELHKKFIKRGEMLEEQQACACVVMGECKKLFQTLEKMINMMGGLTKEKVSTISMLLADKIEKSKGS